MRQYHDDDPSAYFLGDVPGEYDTEDLIDGNAVFRYAMCSPVGNHAGTAGAVAGDDDWCSLAVGDWLGAVGR